MYVYLYTRAFLVLSSKESTCNAGDLGSIWIGNTTWRKAWQPMQYSCLENPVDRGAWRATVHGVTKSQTRLKRLSHMHIYIISVY